MTSTTKAYYMRHANSCVKCDNTLHACIELFLALSRKFIKQYLWALRLTRLVRCLVVCHNHLGKFHLTFTQIFHQVKSLK